MTAKRTATLAMLTALTLILSYVERLIPLDFALPGVKPGLANIGVIVTLFTFGGRWSAAVGLVRVVLSGLLFGGVFAMLYSLAGAVAAIAAMILIRRTNRFGLIGVSVSGAAAHIVAQLAVASALMGSAVWTYAPWLMLAALVTGTFNAVVSSLLLRRIEVLQ